MNRIDKFLKKNGASYNIGISSALQFIVVSIVSGIIIFAIGLKAAGGYIAFASLILGISLPSIMIVFMNKEDNEQIFTDLKALYDTLRISQSAGIFISNALLDSFMYVKNKRFKEALKEVSKDIIAEKDITSALDSLADKFENDYISEFCTTISQSVSTGQMAGILDEIKKQMISIEDIVNQRKESRIERKLLIIEILLFMGILAVTIYGLALSAIEQIYSL